MAEKLDLLDYLRGDIGPDGLNSKPVGVTHAPGQDGIFQVQRDGATARWFQVKGSWNDPPPASDWQEHWYDDDAIYMAIDTSRPPADGGPYTLLDPGAARGSKWAKRKQSVDDVTPRGPYVVDFDMKNGARTKMAGPVTTWLKLAARHDRWHGLVDVIELWWLVDSPTAAAPRERYYYARGLGLVGFEGPDHRTYPNGVFPDFPPAANIPVLKRKPAPWLPAMSDVPPTTDTPGDDWLLNPCHNFRFYIWDNFGARLTPEPDDGDKSEWHPAVDITFASGAVAPFPVVAARAGTVTRAGWDATGYGNLVELAHADNRKTRYAHLNEIDPKITVGAQVIISQRLGEMGWTGRVVPQGEAGRHLHFEYLIDGVAVNPRPLLRDTLPDPVVVTPDPDPDPEPTPDPVTPPPADPGLLAGNLTIDEQRQLIAAKTAEHTALLAAAEAVAAQIAIYQRALDRATV